MRKPYYGWVIVGVSFLIGFTEAGVFQNILAIFMKPMVHDFGWSRASVTGAIAFGSLFGGLLSFFVGPILDRHGPRLVAFWGILLLSSGLVAMTSIAHIWQFYLFFGTGRMIAVGVLRLATSVAVANWFLRLRGRAMGITSIGDRLGSALLPIMVQFLILALGWRMAWGVLGLVVFIMSGVPALLLLRRRPEDMGLMPDGASPLLHERSLSHNLKKGDRLKTSADDGEPAWTRSQAARTKTFWMLTLLNSLIPFLQAGINFHIYPFITDQGYSETIGVLILGTIAISGTVGALAWGMMTERFRIQGLITANVFGNGLIFLLLYWTISFKFNGVLGIGLIFFLAILHGIFHAGRNVMISILWADFFGRRSLGSIYSLSNPFHTASNALGPIFAALFFDAFGSYVFPFHFFVLTFFLSGIITINLRRPKHPSQTTSLIKS